MSNSRWPLAALEAFFLRQRLDFPCGGVEAHDALRAVAFKQHAAFHFDLHAAAAGSHGDLAELDDVPAVAIIDGVVGQQAFSRGGDAPLGRLRIIFGKGERPALRLLVEALEFGKELGIHTVE